MPSDRSPSTGSPPPATSDTTSIEDALRDTELGPRTPLAARVLSPRVFYGWYLAIATTLLMFVGVGVGYYGLAVFLKPLREDHGWSNTAVSGATGMYFVISGITGALIGPRIDRRGPISTQFIGVIMIGVSVILIGHVTDLWQLYAVYAVLAVGFGLSTGVAVNAILARWFVHRRALAISISATGVSLGGVVLAPLGTALIDRGGISLAAMVMGIVVLIVGPAVVAGVLVFDPRQMGLKPDNGWVPRARSGRNSLSDAVQQRRWTRAEAIRTVPFWAILVGYVLVLTAQTGFVLHQISFLEERLASANAAAVALSVTAGGSIVARIIVGVFADGIDKRLLTVGLFITQATAVALVSVVSNIVITYVLVLIVGFTIGNIYMMQALLVGETFGAVSFGTVMGMITLAGQTGSGAGPFVVGVLEDATGGYQVPFIVTSVVTLIAAGAIWFARPPVVADTAHAVDEIDLVV